MHQRSVPLTIVGVGGDGFGGFTGRFEGTDRQACALTSLRGTPLAATPQQAVAGGLQQAPRQPARQEKLARHPGSTPQLRS
jgi:hypothetical protein